MRQKLITLVQHIYLWFYMAVRYLPIRYIAKRCMCALLFFAMFGVCFSMAHACNAATADAQATPEKETYQTELVVGSRTITLSLQTDDDSYQFGEAVESAPDNRKLRRRTVTTIPLYRTEDMATAAETTVFPAAYLTMTLDSIDGNYGLYFQSDAPCAITAVLETDAAQEVKLRSITADDEEPSDAAYPIMRIPYRADTAYYIENDTFHLYTGKIENMTSLGSTVYACTTPEKGIWLDRNDTKLSVVIPLHAETDGITAAAAFLTSNALLDWDEPFAVSTALTLDASANNFHLFADGVYLYEPTTYRPHLAEDSTQDHIYLSAAAWMLGPCTDPRSGALFSTIGKSIVYTYIDRINEEGFIPTLPSSTWLSEDHDIGAGFYDTRFNFDTIRRLLYADKAWNDPTIRSAIERMLNFYLEYADANAYTIRGMQFVPDYGQPMPDTYTPTKRRPSCSLNHYLTEGTFLIRVGRAYHNERFVERGLQILDVIEKSAYRWIRETGDLWYAIRTDGNMEKNDYIEVTYSDLVSTLALLSKMDLSDEYPRIRELYDSKRDWLRRAGYPEVIAAYSLDELSDPSDDISETILFSQPSVQYVGDMLFPLLTVEMRDMLLQITSTQNNEHLPEDTSGSPDDTEPFRDTAISEVASVPAVNFMHINFLKGASSLG